MNPPIGTDGLFSIPFEEDTVMPIRWKCMDMTVKSRLSDCRIRPEGRSSSFKVKMSSVSRKIYYVRPYFGRALR
jgi:hypothetical protein